MFSQDERVYKAAREFAMQSPEGTIRDILLKSIEFDEDSVDEIMEKVEFHRNDIDGGYSNFIKVINQLLGQKVYCINCDNKKYKSGEACRL
jgi:hypothetical protein